MFNKDRIVVEVNSNFHHVGGENLFEQKNNKFNEYRKKWEEWPKTFHAGFFPLFIDIEVTSVCNLKCPFCATTYWNKAINKGYISFTIVKRIIDEGAVNGLYGVKFNLRGEPLLHQQIHEFVKYAKQKGLIDVYFNTNALFLSEEISRKLIDAGLDRISISFEGYTKDVYEKHRVNSNFETVVANIENLQSLKKKLNVRHPKVRIQSVMLSAIKKNFEKYREFWSSRVDEIGYLDYKKIKIKSKNIKYPWVCPQIWQRMAVWWDGTILPCNHDDKGLLALGNIAKTTIKEVWNSQRLNTIRNIHKTGMAHMINACNGCYLRDSEILKLMKKA
ncbi:MAG: radical SAM protein [Candidatus Omnitrophota bacterium]|nr:radical SAM protein [Candidatus Omnitrophota bacterium]